MSTKHWELPSGDKMPMLGLGTFDSKDEALVIETVKHAILHEGY